MLQKCTRLGYYSLGVAEVNVFLVYFDFVYAINMGGNKLEELDSIDPKFVIYNCIYF